MGRTANRKKIKKGKNQEQIAKNKKHQKNNKKTYQKKRKNQ